MHNPLAFSSTGALRDAFLNALDTGTEAEAVELAQYLTRCTNRLPSVTCTQCGLPAGSTYGMAASALIDRGSAPR
jgi:hypothetical protein